MSNPLTESALAIAVGPGTASTSMPAAAASRTSTLPGCRVSASCDLTKLYEKTIRGDAQDVLAMLRANEKAEKGEYCLVLDMSGVTIDEEEPLPQASLEAQLFEELLCGSDLRAAGERLMERGAKRNEVYRARTNVQRFLEDMIEQATAGEDESDE